MFDIDGEAHAVIGVELSGFIGALRIDKMIGDAIGGLGSITGG